MLTRPALLLRLEEASLLAAAVLLYAHLRFSWWMFGLLFFVPDCFMIGYRFNVRMGSALYNLGHAVFMPVVLFGFALWTHRTVPAGIALIWFSHIAFDRMVGYGLKYPTHFKDTHLQHVDGPAVR